MKKQDFINLGISEELALKCEQALSEELKAYVPKAQYDEVVVAKKQVDLNLKEHNTQLEALKNSTGDIKELKKTIETLQADNKAKEETHSKEMHKLKLDNAVEIALRKVNALNPKTVLPLLEGLEKAKFDDTGAIVGLSEQLEKLTAGEDTSFLFKQEPARTIRGASIGESGNDEGEQAIGSNNTSYDNIVKMLEQNPNAKLE